MVHRGSKEKRSHAERQEHKAHVPLGDTGLQGPRGPQGQASTRRFTGHGGTTMCVSTTTG